MEINDKLKLEIIDLTSEGLGVAKVDGYTLFIDGALPGETIDATVTEVGKSYGYATLNEVLVSSKNRVRPKCKNASICGGCNLMHLDYEKQLLFKRKMVIEALKRIGHIENVTIEKIYGMENPYFYRNKIQVPFAQIKDKMVCGYYQKKSHTITPLSECFIQPEIATDIVKFIKNICNELGIKGYNEFKKTGTMRHVLIRKNYQDELMVVLVTNEEKVLSLNTLVDKIKSRYPKVISIIQNINTLGNNVILGENSRVLFGTKYIQDMINGFKFNISHQAFFQVNTTQTEKLYNKVVEYAALNSKTSVIDAYCGVGTISIMLAKNAYKVYGIEVVKEAIVNAKMNASLNGIDNIEFIVGKVEEKITDYIDKGVTTMVVDPPRKGMENIVIDAIINSNIKRIVYVSCNPATLARDLESFKQYYEVKKISLVDMFCHTSNIETVLLMERK